MLATVIYSSQLMGYVGRNAIVVMAPCEHLTLKPYSLSRGHYCRFFLSMQFWGKLAKSYQNEDGWNENMNNKVPSTKITEFTERPSICLSGQHHHIISYHIIIDFPPPPQRNLESATGSINIQWRIQDFPQGGRQLPNVLLFFNFLPKTAWKWKNLDPRGGTRPWRPPWIRQWYWYINILNRSRLYFLFRNFQKKKIAWNSILIADKIDYKYVDLLLSQKTESASDTIPIKDTESKTNGKGMILLHK